METPGFLIKEIKGSCFFPVKVIPRSSKNKCVGIENGKLKIKIQAPPVEGAANNALLDFLAALLDKPRSSMRVMKGEKSRHKIVEIQNLTAARLSEILKKSKGG